MWPLLVAISSAFVLTAREPPTVARARTPLLSTTPVEPPVEPPYERPGNYVQPYSSALGVSTAAVLCGELVPIPGFDVVTTSLLGRLAACTSLPLLWCTLAAMRVAAVKGPSLLRLPSFERLNLGIALSSLAACVVSPRPVVSVLVARGGTALLCLEVWSKWSGATSGDPVSEVVALLRGLCGGLQRAVGLCFAGVTGGVGGTASSLGAPAAVRAYAALALAHVIFALSLLCGPSSVAALWPLASPGVNSMRVAASSSILTAACATTLADLAESRPAAGTGEGLRPFRHVNQIYPRPSPLSSSEPGSVGPSQDPCGSVPHV